MIVDVMAVGYIHSLIPDFIDTWKAKSVELADSQVFK